MIQNELKNSFKNNIKNTIILYDIIIILYLNQNFNFKKCKTIKIYIYDNII